MNKIFILLSIFTTLIQADVNTGKWCYNEHIFKINQIKFKEFALSYSFEEWLDENENNQAGLIEDLGYPSKAARACIPHIMSALLYETTKTLSEKSKKYGIKCYQKTFEQPLHKNLKAFSRKYKVLQIVELMKEEGEGLLNLTNNEVHSSRSYREKCVVPIMQSMIIYARDTPK